MKKFLIALFFLLLLLYLSLTISSCDKCDSERYQIHDKVDLGTGKCNYEVWAFTECATWQRREIIKFQTDCSKFQLSQVVSKEDIAPYR